ncbi:MAG: hypothetical protein KC503_30445 [Myxococcales bacterium]|nr:hypothetical protein [Myxococcales bacterium]
MAAVLSPSAAWGADYDSTSYKNHRLGIDLTVPEGWTITRQTGYRSMLLLATPLQRGKSKPQQGAPKLAEATIALSYGWLGRRTLAWFITESKRGLAGVGLGVTSERPAKVLNVRGVWIEARTKDGKQAVLQLYHKHGQRVLVWTLRCPPARLKTLGREIERFIDALKLKPT